MDGPSSRLSEDIPPTLNSLAMPAPPGASTKETCVACFASVLRCENAKPLRVGMLTKVSIGNGKRELDLESFLKKLGRVIWRSNQGFASLVTALLRRKYIIEWYGCSGSSRRFKAGPTRTDSTGSNWKTCVTNYTTSVLTMNLM